MNVSVKNERTYDLTGLTEYQARDLLYFISAIPKLDIARNGRQDEFFETLRNTLLNAGLTLKIEDPN